jgi:two-component system response regulator FlrC
VFRWPGVLRERPADILPLAERLLARHANKMKHARCAVAEAQACLRLSLAGQCA